MIRGKVAALVIGTVTGAAALTGCGSTAVTSQSPDQVEHVDVFPVRLSDGRTIDCIYLDRHVGNASTGGPSCDWSHPK